MNSEDAFDPKRLNSALYIYSFSREYLSWPQTFEEIYVSLDSAGEWMELLMIELIKIIKPSGELSGMFKQEEILDAQLRSMWRYLANEIQPGSFDTFEERADWIEKLIKEAHKSDQIKHMIETRLKAIRLLPAKISDYDSFIQETKKQIAELENQIDNYASKTKKKPGFRKADLEAKLDVLKMSLELDHEWAKVFQTQTSKIIDRSKGQTFWIFKYLPNTVIYQQEENFYLIQGSKLKELPFKVPLLNMDAPAVEYNFQNTLKKLQETPLPSVDLYKEYFDVKGVERFLSDYSIQSVIEMLLIVEQGITQYFTRKYNQQWGPEEERYLWQLNLKEVKSPEELQYFVASFTNTINKCESISSDPNHKKYYPRNVVFGYLKTNYEHIPLEANYAYVLFLYYNTLVFLSKNKMPKRQQKLSKLQQEEDSD